MSNTPEKAANNYIGETPIRVDAYDKATGKGLFASDYYKFIPDLLHIKILRSPVAHCKITKLDLSKAEAMPGVAKIFTMERSPFHMERLPESVRFSRSSRSAATRCRLTRSWALCPAAAVSSCTALTART